ncbi:MAG TPA: hypothetical protein VMM12_04165 [Longimicrobiales bacterium]|nr:hypothetical protein [Longimicrobiales bacterium]
MSQASPFQRFARELRRRHVPQTAAVYLVAAWAAIQFADVVVPNLNGPQWVVTAVIVAAGVGFPVVLALAWVFEWGPEGIHRTGAEESPGAARSRAGTPMIAAVAVLVVGIGSALAVAALLPDGDAGDGGEDASGTVTRERPPGPPEAPELVPRFDVDSFQEALTRQLGDLEGLRDLGRLGAPGGPGASAMDSLDMGEFIELAMTMAEEAELAVLLRQPREWRLNRRVPVPLVTGDTLRIDGVALDSAGTGRSGIRRVEIVVRTAAGREIRRDDPVHQRPGGSP